MIGVRGFSIYTVTVAANTDLPIHTAGEYVACTAASAAFLLRLDNNAFNAFEAGFKLRMPEEETFETVWLRNEGGAAVTVTLIVGYGDFADNRLTVSGAIDVSKSTVLDSLADDSIAATSTELIAAADANRRELIVTNLPTNSQTFRIGDSGAGAANGVPLVPGASLILSTTAAVYAYNPGASAESLSVVSVED